MIEVRHWPRWLRDEVRTHPSCQGFGVERKDVGDETGDEVVYVEAGDDAAANLSACLDNVAHADRLLFTHGIDRDGTVHANERILLCALRAATPEWLRTPSPVKSREASPSPPRDDPSPPRDASREPSPPRDASREPSPLRDASREPSPPRDASRDPSVPRDVPPSPPRDASREPSPTREVPPRPPSPPARDARPPRPTAPRRDPSPPPTPTLRPSLSPRSPTRSPTHTSEDDSLFSFARPATPPSPSTTRVVYNEATVYELCGLLPPDLLRALGEQRAFVPTVDGKRVHLSRYGSSMRVGAYVFVPEPTSPGVYVATSKSDPNRLPTRQGDVLRRHRQRRSEYERR
jgi:hypothetical protein